jgi:hypothetical protein
MVGMTVFLYEKNTDMIKNFFEFGEKKYIKEIQEQSFAKNPVSVCIITDDKSSFQILDSIGINNYRVFNTLSVKCQDVEDCNKVIIMDYSENNKDELDCIIKTKNTLIRYGAIKNKTIESDLVMTTGTLIPVDGKIEKTYNCYESYCVFLNEKEYKNTLYNAQCYDTPKFVVDNKPFLCDNGQNRIFFFNITYLLNNYGNESKGFLREIIVR